MEGLTLIDLDDVEAVGVVLPDLLDEAEDGLLTLESLLSLREVFPPDMFNSEARCLTDEDGS